MRFVWAEGGEEAADAGAAAGVERVPFQVEIEEVKPGDTVEGQGRGKGGEYDNSGVRDGSMVADPSATRSREHERPGGLIPTRRGRPVFLKALVGAAATR